MELLIISALLSVVTFRFIDYPETHFMSIIAFFAWVGFFGCVNMFVRPMLRAYRQYQGRRIIKSRMNKYM
jgi:hypothetical protein